MKDAEDEAFDELARRQGGGGFQAKRVMAKARVKDDDDIQDYKRPWVGLTEDELLHIGVATGLERAAAQMIEAKLKERNF